MNVLHVINEMGSGGAEAVVAELARAALASGDTVRIASHGGRREEELARAGAVAVRTPLHRRSGPGVLAAATALARQARRARPDVVHAHNVGASLVAHVGVRWPRRTPPLLTTFHGVADADYPGAAAWLRRTADLVVAVSGAVGDRLVAAGFPAGGLRVVDNAVTPPAPVDRAAARRDLGLDPDVPVALCAARLVEQKRHDLLLAAWAAVPSGVLLLAGTGPLGDDVAATVRRLGLSDRVRLLGERSDVGALLGAADAFCLASDWEGMPMAVLEAMAAGVPVVATAVDGLVDGCGTAARLVPPRDPDALGAALADVLGDAAVREAMAAEGRALTSTRYATATMVSAYRTAYASLTG